MKNMLVTGGTVFVSRCMAAYFVRRGWRVHVLNRGTREQPDGVQLIRADRHQLGDALKAYHFDAVIDVTAYDAQDVNDLLDALGSYDDYILISSSAVYPETEMQPFREDARVGENAFWGRYGTHKIAAEEALRARKSGAYILRPPYLYREAFVFDCALADRPFYLPGEGRMKLQFFHVDDLCRFAEILLQVRPAQYIFNVGSGESVTVADWVRICYAACGKEPEFVPVSAAVEQRNYFPFYNYEYALDVSAQSALMPSVKPLAEGLREALTWYLAHGDQVRKKPLLAYIDSCLAAINQEETASSGQ